jgi:hypothetical protein
VNEEKLYKQLKEKAEKAPVVKKSKFQQRLEEMQRAQQQQSRRR